MIAAAIDYYHELLNEHLQSTRELLEAQNERLSVGGRPTCRVLRPYFISEDSYNFVRQASSLVMKGICTLSDELLRNPMLRKEMDLSDQEEQLIQIQTGYGAPDVSARLDGFLAADGSFHFVEYNADSPGGIGYGDALSDVFAEMPIMNQFAQRYGFRTLPVRAFVFDAILAAYRRWGGAGGRSSPRRGRRRSGPGAACRSARLP